MLRNSLYLENYIVKKEELNINDKLYEAYF